MRHKITLILLFTLILSGCASYSTFQTARVLPKGDKRLALHGEYFTLDPDPALSKKTVEQCSLYIGDTCAIPLSKTFVNAGGYGRVGLGNAWDVGVRINLPFSLASDVKYQFIDESGFSLATGFGLTIFQFYPRLNYLEKSVITLMFPFYASYDFSPVVSIYSSLKYFPGATTNDILIPKNQVASGSIGLKIGEDWGVFLEASEAKDLSSDLNLVSFEGSFFFTFHPPKKEAPPPAWLKPLSTDEFAPLENKRRK